jgi:Fe-S cluster assembly scaffold protein SufB
MYIIHNDTQNIVIEAGKEELIVELVDGFSCSKTITLQKGAKLLYLLIATDASVQIKIITEGEGSEAIVQSVIASRHDKAVRGSLSGVLSASHTQIDMQMLSLLGERGCVEFNGSVRIDPNIIKTSGHLHQDSVIIGNDVRLTTLPELDVRSDDVSASHGSRIHAINPFDTFYMMSRGLTEYEGQCLIIDGYINAAFARFGAANHAELLSIKSHILTHLALPLLSSDD